MNKAKVSILVSGIMSLFTAVYPALAENWVYMGKADTGEDISVDADSIYAGKEGKRFIYTIGNETLHAAANCNNNTWYVLEYDTTYSPQSNATQQMLVYVCQY
ncbi:hypothetical protein PCC9214_00607 [Planktothrix tepida]|uniref:Uncharacterized protein n=1 Tax=Planktothrix tepida PCC 9214 TaxID=671072 RepID=A0A1J1LEM0_9CYAN|nr:hypothetical protein PCC9214_00607 [Planktothrix tepida]CUR30896.1 conserved exported hypothetical protein [Planktothrix tepida PCC 9214]